MKKTALFCTAIFAMLCLQNCSSSKKTSKVAAISYATQVAPIMQASCAPCHFPPDGKKQALNNYETVKSHVAEVIARVKLPQADPKFMPFKNKKPAFTEAEVALLENWVKQGMPQ
jgi:hypothetical protein